VGALEAADGDWVRLSWCPLPSEGGDAELSTGGVPLGAAEGFGPPPGESAGTPSGGVGMPPESEAERLLRRLLAKRRGASCLDLACPGGSTAALEAGSGGGGGGCRGGAAVEGTSSADPSLPLPCPPPVPSTSFRCRPGGCSKRENVSLQGHSP